MASVFPYVEIARHEPALAPQLLDLLLQPFSLEEDRDFRLEEAMGFSRSLAGMPRCQEILAHSDLIGLRTTHQGHDAACAYGYASPSRSQPARVEPASYVLCANSRIAAAGSGERRTSS